MRKFHWIVSVAAIVFCVAFAVIAVIRSGAPIVPEGFFAAPDEMDQKARDEAQKEALKREATGVYADGELLFAVLDENTAAEVIEELIAFYRGALPAEETVMETALTREITFMTCWENVLSPENALQVLKDDPSLCPVQFITRKVDIAAQERPSSTVTTADSRLNEQTQIVRTPGLPAYRYTITDGTYLNGERTAQNESTTADPSERNVVKGTGNAETETAMPPRIGIALERPCSGATLLRFGCTEDGMSYGVDLYAKPGTPVCAAADGVVVFAGARGNYGFVVEVDHGGGVVTRYSHCDQCHVGLGREVKKGQTLALAADRDAIEGDPLLKKYERSYIHFEVWVDGIRYDPRVYLNEIQPPETPDDASKDNEDEE